MNSRVAGRFNPPNALLFISEFPTGRAAERRAISRIIHSERSVRGRVVVYYLRISLYYRRPFVVRRAQRNFRFRVVRATFRVRETREFRKQSFELISEPKRRAKNFREKLTAFRSDSTRNVSRRRRARSFSAF